ncbi:MAG: OmpH family outer membrane protein [Bacteroidales bacterium]|jgi:outer membrane protein|nr:OmpH family outer membrane protein [Bacteroidales bacterium]
MEEQINENPQELIPQEQKEDIVETVSTQKDNVIPEIVKIKKRLLWSYILAVVALLTGVVLLLCGILCKNQCKVDTPTGNTPKIIQNGNMKIAYINTDSIMEHYLYAKDLEAGLKAYQSQVENEVKGVAQKLQKDYEEYLKTGDKLTLTKQKEKEKELTERQQKLPYLQQEMAAKLQERQFNDNKKLVDAIYAFIEDYNKNHDNFTIILRKEYINSPVLYIDKGMDITDEIIKGLNEEYKQIKK